MRRGLVLATIGLALALLLSGCDWFASESAVQKLTKWASGVESEAEDLRPAQIEDFHPDPAPIDRLEVATLAAAGVQAGHRAEFATADVTSGFRISPAEKKHLTCFLTSKALDHELPRSPEQVFYEVAEYFGESFAERVEYIHYAVASIELSDAMDEIEEKGEVTAGAALATVCNG